MMKYIPFTEIKADIESYSVIFLKLKTFTLPASETTGEGDPICKFFLIADVALL